MLGADREAAILRMETITPGGEVEREHRTWQQVTQHREIQAHKVTPGKPEFLASNF